MKITMLGSLGHINQIVIPQLIAAGHTVTVITSSPKRVAAIEALGATAAVGTMADGQFLTQQFQNQDVVYLMISGPAFNTTDMIAGAKAQGEIFYQAIQTAQVKNVVDLSSIGADAGPEAGALYAYHFIEDQLKQLTDVNLAFVRPVGFYSNLYSHLSNIKAHHRLATPNDPNLLAAYVAPADIAAVILPLLTQTPAGVSVHYAISDMFTLNEFVTTLQQTPALADLKIDLISDAQYAAALATNKLPQTVIDNFVQMVRFERDPEKVYRDLKQHHPTYGHVKLADFARAYVQAILGDADDAKANTIVS
ncbi:hypothetical protein FC83_GL003002 [Agrilactobacillus composti DSM 18527 = JCM 14202]|uniref:NAD(P)-binding domain-containing protein n=1 Tax=Agrilactobacillus composti DSM 18527 = JCM 14202 TaxID=1423734 RepID=X0PQJ1_9LACO|nr:NAD(P)H-binding protein [Agrilactobacillus composti]KRM36251.1 hypothetical protein FC83_GL003002 [Agrilactobacillus composti DSM 18527 = JCM 14202]GAF39992.1 hypothetical protein JCM14202_1875 [Agrilactobacillus composti DSM 18527 = JCM 14202]